MNLSSVFQAELWQRRMQQLRTQAKRFAPFASGMVATLAAILLYNFFVPAPHQMTMGEVNGAVEQVLATIPPPPAFSASVYQAILPSFVLIQTHATNEGGEEGSGIGSGVVVDDSGSILTSLHVVAKASDIKVTFADGTEAKAMVIATQPENDIAVLSPSQLPAELLPATLGNPNAMHIGDEAYVVGNPLGLYGSMSAGIISGLDRSYRPPNSKQPLQGLIQFDAAVNPGNSGGPLLNRAGQVIGIVAGLANPTDESVFIGIGFAVPINVAGGAAGLPPY